MKPTINSIEWWIKRIKDSTIRNNILTDPDYESCKEYIKPSIFEAINYAVNPLSSYRQKYLELATWSNTINPIELLDDPVYDLPEKYYVKNPWPQTSNSPFPAVIQALQKHWTGDAAYYKFSGTNIEAYGEAPTGIPEIPYEDWKAHVLQHTGKSIPVSVQEDGKYKIGHWVYITRDRNWAKESDVAQITGFDGVHWYIQGLRGEKGCFYFTENSPIARSATPEEIAQAASPSYKADDWVVVTRERGISTAHEWLRNKCYQVGGIETHGQGEGVRLKDKSGKYDGGNGFIYNPDVRPALPHEIPGYKDGWKVGDILPEEWLNKQIFYLDNKQQKPGGFITDRKVDQIYENGNAFISGTGSCQLGPKSEYPTYNTYISTKKEELNNQQSSLTTKTKQNDTSSEKSSSKDNSINLCGNPQAIRTGNTRTATAVRCTGQSECTIRGYRGNSKAVSIL